MSCIAANGEHRYAITAHKCLVCGHTVRTTFTLEIDSLVDIAGGGLHRVVGVGHYPDDMDGPVAVAFLRPVAETDAHQMTETAEHVYLSSACRHATDPGRTEKERSELHGKCQHDTLRYDGTHKEPAQCKECGAPCVCPCHLATPAAGGVSEYEIARRERAQ